MLGRQARGQGELLIAGSLRELIPDDHVLVRVDRVLDLGWLRSAVAECSAAGSGRPGIDPEAAVRLMLAGLLLGIVHDRRLLREAQVNIAIRWFAGYGLAETLPDHSSLTRLRQRWGAERFRGIFARTVQACVAAGIAKGEVVHIDSSLVRADVSWESLARKHADAVEAANGPADPVCRTDPDATLTTNNRARRVEPAYKQHTAVDAQAGVVLDVAVTTGAVHDSKPVEAQLDAIPGVTGTAIETATMDASYAITRVFAALEARGIEAIIPAKAEQPPKRGTIPVRRFKLDAKNRRVRCLAGKLLRPHGMPDSDGFQHYRARIPDCEAYRLRAIGFSTTMRRRAILPSRAAARPPQTRTLGAARAGALPTPPRPGRGRPRRGQDLARPRPCHPPRARQHADPGLPHRRRHQPQAAGPCSMARPLRRSRRSGQTPPSQPRTDPLKTSPPRLHAHHPIPSRVIQQARQAGMTRARLAGRPSANQTADTGGAGIRDSRPRAAR